jgi:hypothetical protein
MPHLQFIVALFVIPSITRMNTNVDIQDPCRTPDFYVNQFDGSSLSITTHLLLMYTTLIMPLVLGVESDFLVLHDR